MRSFVIFSPKEALHYFRYILHIIIIRIHKPMGLRIHEHTQKHYNIIIYNAYVHACIYMYTCTILHIQIHMHTYIQHTQLHSLHTCILYACIRTCIIIYWAHVHPQSVYVRAQTQAYNIHSCKKDLLRLLLFKTVLTLLIFGTFLYFLVAKSFILLSLLNSCIK